MASRLLGRTLTSPLAFLVAGLADFVSYWLAVLRRVTRVRTRY